jgi:LAO/AO transport system kinase
MEIPDIIVVNKSDHPLTDTMIREIRGVLSLAPQHGWRVPIVKTEAARGQGVDELIEQMEATAPTSRPRACSPSAAGATCATRSSRSARTACAAGWRRRSRRTRSSRRLLDEVAERETDPASAATTLLERVDAAEAAPPTGA